MTPASKDKQQSPLDQLARRASLVMVWERAWPVLVALVVVVAVFLTVSWLGLWLELPGWARVAGLAGFGAALLYTLSGLLRLSPPSRAQALSRLDRDSGVSHRPASALEDNLANPGSDPATRALWALHQNRLMAQAARLKVAAPAPRVAERDHFALRAAALVALAGAAFVAGPERNLRVAAAFDWRSATAQAEGFRVDAWLDPPPYTGHAPILLDTKPQTGAKAQRIEAPVGSTLILRATPDATFVADIKGALPLLVPPASDRPQPASAAPDGQRYSLKGDAQLVLQRSGNSFAAFDLHALPDHPPVITLVEPLQPNVRGSMTLNYTISDDYGVISAEASFSKPFISGKPLAGRSLVEPPRVGLALPALPGGLGEGATTADLSEHPWAGARVTMVLTARDEGGNAGSSAPREITLPQRPFTKPMARALAEQRRHLVLNPDDRFRVVSSIEALLIAPEEFATGASVYLGLRHARAMLRRARTDAALLETADFLWEMALRIEEGDLSQSERDLRAAENRLREAMQNNAPDAEIARLMDDVRAALDKFMAELAEKQQREGGPEQQAQNAPRNSRVMTPQDFKAMMDKMQELARSGNMAEAQKMLDQMQKMLENLQTARRRPQDPVQREMNKALDELDAMAREEQNLRDDTFKQDQKQRRQQKGANAKPNQPGGKPRPDGQKGAQSPDQNDPQGDAENESSDTGDAQSAESAQKALKDRQEALRQRLDQLQKRLNQMGQKGQEGLGEALEAMKDAESALGEGESGAGKAVGPEGKALDGLRKGAQKLAESMQQPGDGEGDEQANDDGEDQPGQGQPQGNRQNGKSRDPLGRDDQRKDGQNNDKRGLNAGGAPAQRAQRVLEELRKRLGDANRPAEERDYLERLLKRY